MKAIVELTARDWEGLKDFYPIYKVVPNSLYGVMSKFMKPKVYEWDTKFGSIEVKLSPLPNQLWHHCQDNPASIYMSWPQKPTAGRDAVNGRYVNLVYYQHLWAEILRLYHLKGDKIKIAIVGADKIELGAYIIELVQRMRYVTLVGNRLPRLRYLKHLILKHWGLVTFVSRDRRELQTSDVIFLFDETASQWQNWPVLSKKQLVLGFDDKILQKHVMKGIWLHNFHIRWHEALPQVMQLYFHEYLPASIYEGLILSQANALGSWQEVFCVINQYLCSDRHFLMAKISAIKEDEGIIYVG